MYADPVGSRRSGFAFVRAGVAIVVAVLLLWFVCLQGFAGIAARSGNPALLRLFNPGTYPAAGSQLAQIDLLAKHPDQAAALARPAAFAAPMDVQAVGVLGLSLEARDKAASRRILLQAEKLSWRNTLTSVWVLRDAALHQDLSRVMDQLDALARRQKVMEIVQQLYYACLNDPRARQALAMKLGDAPPWRPGFFADARMRLAPASFDAMESLMDRLDRTRTPSSPAERMTFIDRMVDTGFGTHARDYWVRTFGVPLRMLDRQPFDPAFHAIGTRPADAPVSPFEWDLGPDASQFVSFRHIGADTVLDITPGAGGSVLLEQTLLLAPGSHRIDADIIQGTAQQAPAGWQIACSSSTPLIRGFATPGDELSGVSVTVPPTGCGVQTLRLVSLDRPDAQSVTIRSVSIH